MDAKAESAFKPDKYQAATLKRIGDKAARRVIERGETEFPARSLYEKIRSFGIPQLAVQQSIVEALGHENISAQTFRPYAYKGDSAGPYSELMVRVLSMRDGERMLGALEQGEPIPGHPGFTAADVYPPQE